jgi:hypothetical protein
MAKAAYSHRTHAATSGVPVRLLLIMGFSLLVPDVAYPQEVTVARSEVPDVVARWNAAVRHCHEGKWDAVIGMVIPQERTALHTELGRRLLALNLLSEIRAEEVVVYQEEDGAALARIYGTRAVEEKVEGKAVRLLNRTLLGSMTRQNKGPWLMDFSARDVHPFGLGKSVEGLRLSVVPREQSVRSWQQFRARLVFENTNNTTRSISIQGSPSCYLGRNLAFVLRKAEPAGEKKVFREWYDMLESMSPPPISGLLESMRSTHEPSILRPRERQENGVSLRTLCWKGEAVPEGPTGTFDLFVVYDANLEWDPVESSASVWRHRIASGIFRVVVK